MKNILIVEDDERQLGSYQMILENENTNVYVAPDVRGALTILDLSKIDVAIVDYKLPKITGATLAKHINDKYPDMKVFMISGYDEVVDAVKDLDLNLQGLYRKPIDPKLLEQMAKADD